VTRGAYVVQDGEGTPEVLLLGSGSEVHIAIEAANVLKAEGIKARVVSMPCWELFDEQDAAYRESVLPSSITARVSIEAGRTLGWERYVGMNGIAIGVDKFGASAPFERIYQEYGLTSAAVIAAAKKVLGR
jgi:transketolase